MATASCPANVRETKIAFGFKPQADVATMNLPTEMWSLTKTNPALSVITPVTENDANDIGKGDEFPTQIFPSHMDAAVPVEKYASSEFLAWLFCFATGKASKTAAGTGWTYSAVPSDPVTECINLTPFTFAEQIRTPPDSVIDRAAVGMVVSDFTILMESGPGRNNCRVQANFVGTGRVNAPSGITPWPTVTTEHFLNAASAQITINGIDYVLAKSFISLEFRWTNNVRLDSGFYPGSGTQNGYAVRGRMEYNTRECTLRFVARAAKGSPEYNALVAQPPTEGPASIKLVGALIGAGPSKHGMDIEIPRCVFASVVNGDTDGVVNVDCTMTLLKPVGGGDYITMSATTEFDGILALMSGGPVPPATPPTETLPVASASIPAAGASGQSFDVQSTATWAATSTDAWITITAPTGTVTGDGTVTYIVSANTDPAPRTGHITVGTATFQVDQAGA